MRIALAPLLACLVLAACGEDGNSQDDMEPPVPPGFEQVTGAEKLGWDQPASDARELATFRYLVYVDAAQGTTVQNVSCSQNPGSAGFACTGSLPSMSPGQHSLRLTSFIEADGARLESPPSASLNVFLATTSGVQSSAGPRTLSFPKGPSPERSSFSTTTTDGIEIGVRVAAEGLEEPTDIAVTGDGAVWIAERQGRVRLVRAGRLLPSPALTLTDIVATGEHGLLAIAADPEFDTNRFLYLVYTAEAGFRLARFRAVGDTLGERAILLDGLASSSRPASLLRFGPDNQLYVGFDDGGDPLRAGDLGSFSGKILRLTRDATTPAHQPGASPIYVPDLRSPRGADWARQGGRLWIADDTPDALGQLVVSDAGPGMGTQGRRAVAMRYNLPDGAAPRGLVFYEGELFPALRGNVLVATEEPGGEASILRVSFDPANGGDVVGTERLLRGSIDSARAIGVGPDGVVYLCTRTALLGLTPAAAR